MFKARRGLSSVMGSLFLIVVVFVAWAALFRYGLSYVQSTQGLPEVSLSSKVVSLNGGGVYMVEIDVRSGGYYPFVIQKVNVVVGGNTYSSPQFLYTSFNQNPTTVNLPLSLRPGQTYTLYFFTSNLNIPQGTVPIVQVIGTYGPGGNLVEYQSSAEVLYG
jgi:flagellin-like protein